MSTEGKTEAITRITTERGWLGHHAVTLMCGEAWDAAIGPLVEAIEAYDKAAIALTDQQLIDNQPLMAAIANGRAALKAAGKGK